MTNGTNPSPIHSHTFEIELDTLMALQGYEGMHQHLCEELARKHIDHRPQEVTYVYLATDDSADNLLILIRADYTLDNGNLPN